VTRASDKELEPLRAALAQGDGAGAEALAAALLKRHDTDAELWRLGGLSAAAAGDMREAFRRMTRALAREPRMTQAWIDLGELYAATDQLDQSGQAYYRAVSIDERSVRAWNGMGNALDALGRYAEAADAFRHALTLDAELSDTRLHLTSTLIAMGDLGAAEFEATAALAAAPESAEAHFVFGNVRVAQRRHSDAVEAFRAALARKPDYAQAQHNLAMSLDELGDWTGAAQACAAALRLDPSLVSALAQLVFLKRRLCDWTGLTALSERLRDAVAAGHADVTPFSFLSEPATPAEQLACARAQAARIVARMEPIKRRSVFATRGFGVGRPRVGFVSSGFNNHPTALLIADFVERLRNTNLETVAFATTADDGGALRKRLRTGFHQFHEAHGITPATLAGRVNDARIDVLVDLRGYGGGSASEMFALRPAPIQVNWLAYPGTSGAPFIDYLIADRYVVAPEQRAHYSEAIVRMPYAFQCSDATRVVGTPPPRAALGLPEQAVVFVSFNNSYKIGPEVFQAWLRILRDVPDSVLWLLAGKDEAAVRGHLHQHARTAGIDPARVIFQQKLPHDQYLALYRHADLFLDTWPYGAHTTASDALWAGCPVLTWPGTTFASRVAGSLLATLDMPELIARDLNDYLAKAVVAGRSVPARKAMHAKLEAARTQSPLFDMSAFAQAFERAITGMVGRARRGLKPEDFDIDDER
jgi:predicted O-linked N-acetylglucosamine transferase (SPINDLY family)